jgi:glutamate-1-semialdehyde 2,1-aminomutase
MTIVGFTSTGSKRPHALFGPDVEGLPQRMHRSAGCMVHATDGREYLDFIMALGAVALGYGHADVTRAVIDAVERGTIGPLSPDDESSLAAELGAAMPWLENVLFLKTGAEAVAAAVRIARVATGRRHVIGCGYHGWLDWCSDADGVPLATRDLYATVPFNDAEQTQHRIRAAGDRLACVVVEPVIDEAPGSEWLAVLRSETERVGAILIFDEIKTAFRIAIGGAAEKWGVKPDLTVLGKAMANGYPLAAVGGSRALMHHATRTWISSTMATEFVSLAAARATVAAMKAHDVPRRLDAAGSRLLNGLKRLATQHGDLGIRVAGIPQMCYLRHDNVQTSHRLAIECARRGLLFKRTAYNFVSLAHDEAAIDRALDILADALAAC